MAGQTLRLVDGVDNGHIQLLMPGGRLLYAVLVHIMAARLLGVPQHRSVGGLFCWHVATARPDTKVVSRMLVDSGTGGVEHSSMDDATYVLLALLGFCNTSHKRYH